MGRHLRLTQTINVLIHLVYDINRKIPRDKNKIAIKTQGYTACTFHNNTFCDRHSTNFSPESHFIKTLSLRVAAHQKKQVVTD